MKSILQLPLKQTNINPKLFIFTLLIFIVIDIYAQLHETGMLPIRNYTPEDYNAREQNFSITQDNRGILYVANNGGFVLEYDGKNWRTIENISETPIRVVATDKKGRVYIGANDQLGYLASDSLGNIVFISLLKYIPEHKINAKIENIIVFKNNVIFCTKAVLYFWRKDTIIQIKAKNAFTYFGVLDSNFYVCENKIGLFIYQNNTLHLVNTMDIFKQNITTIIDYDKERYLIVTINSGLYITSSKQLNQNISITRFHTQVDEILNETPILNFIKINDTTYSIGTEYKGAVIINSKGEFVDILNKMTGLQDETIQNQFIDNTNKLWLALDNGISMVDICSSISYFNEKTGLEGIIQSIIRFHDTLFIASKKGTYILSHHPENIFIKSFFKKLNQVNQASWDLLPFSINNKEILLLALNDGVYIYGKKLKLITNCAPWCLHQYSKYPNIIFIGDDVESLLAIYYKNNRWRVYRDIQEISGAVRIITEDNEGNLWLGTQNNGLYKIRINIQDNKIKDIKVLNHYDKNSGLPQGFTFYYPGPPEFISTNEGPYLIDKDNKVKKNTYLSRIIDRYIHRAKKDFKNNIWLVSFIDEKDNTKDRYELGYLHYSDDSLGWYSLPFKSITKSIQAIYHEKNGITWLGGANILYRYNANIHKNYRNRYHAYIRTVKTSKDSIIFNGCFFDQDHNITLYQPEHQKPILKYINNEIRFEFSAQSNEDQDNIEYSYILLANDKEWSKWSNVQYKEYNNLHEGDYIFKVKARNIYGNISSIATYSFTILPPWYRTIWAYIGYIVTFILILYTSIQLYTRRLRMQKLRLEQIVKERTEEIRRKNKELEKLSIVASETDNAVIITDAEGNIEWVNDGFTRLLGYTLEEFKKEKGENLITISYNPKIKEVLYECITKKESVVYEAININKAGEEIWLQTTLTPILDKDNKIKKLIAIDSDITKIKEAELEIKQKNKEITDSIHYAQRIQQAVLPSETFLSNFSDFFILFKPKDIVSGDFYWMSKKENLTIVTAADCTGHGVPGAFMSMLGMSFLNKIVNEEGILQASEILNKLRENVIQALKQKGILGETKDGMDITLIIVDLEKKLLQFAGANNPLYIVRDKNLPEIASAQRQLKIDEYVLYEIRGDKMPVAIHPELQSFTEYNITLYQGDTLYLFSDGYADQFGGPNSKKFKYKAFQRLLLENQRLSLNEQKIKLNKTIEYWMSFTDPYTGKKYEQIDDIVIIGLRI